MAPRKTTAPRKPLVKPPPNPGRYQARREAKKAARAAQAIATVAPEDQLTAEPTLTQHAPARKTAIEKAKKTKFNNTAKRVYRPKSSPRPPIQHDHPHRADLRVGDGRLHRRENWETRTLHRFHKLLPNEATPVDSSDDAVNWRCYAERNDEAKYHHQVIVNGTPGFLQIVGTKISWSASAREGKGGADVRDDSNDIAFEIDEHTLLHRRFVDDRIVLRIQCGETYISNGEPGLDYKTYTVIVSNQHDARWAINILNWRRQVKVDASLDAAAKELANLHESEDEEDPLDQNACHGYETDDDSAVVELVKTSQLRHHLDHVFNKVTKNPELADQYILKRYMDEEQVDMVKLDQWESPSEAVMSAWEAPREEEPMPKRYDQGRMIIE